jgi:uncharacterized protein YbbK (DUF523 family)
MKKKLLISACLYGEECRYDGKSNKLDSATLSLLKQEYELVPVCPEVLGGLPTPRTPSERVGDRVIMKNGQDVTVQFKKGAAEALRIAVREGASGALLKERSPSCGYEKIYDGSFSGELVAGRGVCAELLISEGISVFGESDIEKLLKKD